MKRLAPALALVLLLAAPASAQIVSGLGTISGLTANGFVYPTSATAITSTAAASNGQLLIGSTGVAPVLAALTGTANQITVANGAGTITLSLPSPLVTPGNLGITGNGILRSGDTFGFSSSATDPTVACDACLARDAADIVAIKRSTNPQGLRVYNSTTSDDFGCLRWLSNNFELIASCDNTDARNLILDGNASVEFQVNTTQQWAVIATAFRPTTNGTENIGTSTLGISRLYFDYTNTAVGTTGNQTINKTSGRVNIAAAGTSVVVTNDKVTAASQCFAQMVTNDATGRVTACVSAAGSFTIYTVAVTAEAAFAYQIINTN